MRYCKECTYINCEQYGSDYQYDKGTCGNFIDKREEQNIMGCKRRGKDWRSCLNCEEYLECNPLGEPKRGLKHDSGKLRYDLIPVKPLAAIAAVLTFGAKKYKANSWQELDNFKERYSAAAMRHFELWRGGEIYDKESGLHHLAHALVNLMFLLWNETK